MRKTFWIKHARLLKKIFGGLMSLALFPQAGALPVPAFDSRADRDSLEEAYSPQSAGAPGGGIKAVFFERSDGLLVPKCQISAEKYPGILPGFVKDAHSHLKSYPQSVSQENLPVTQRNHLNSDGFSGGFSGEFSGGFSGDFVGLEDCDSNLSWELSAKAARAELYPQVAAAPLVAGAVLVAVNAISCALSGTMGALGGYELAEELENGYREARREAFEKEGIGAFSYFPTRGEFGTGAAAALGGSLSGVMTYAHAPPYYAHVSKDAAGEWIKKEVGKRSLAAKFASGIGVLCAVGGATLGFFSRKLEIANRKTEAANYRAEAARSQAQDVGKFFLRAHARGRQLQGDLRAAEERNSRLQRVLELKESLAAAVIEAKALSSIFSDEPLGESDHLLAERTGAEERAAEAWRIVQELEAEIKREKNLLSAENSE